MQYGTVTGRILATIADRVNDPDTNPDTVPVSGKVRFTPSVASVISSSDNAIIMPTPIEADLDSDGYVSLNGVRGVTLVATDSADLNPTGFTYTVSFSDLKFDKFNLSYAPFSMSLPAGSTVDLSSVTPVGSSNGALIVRGPKGDKGDPAANVVTLSAANTLAAAQANVAALNAAITAGNTAGGRRIVIDTAGVYQLSGSVLMRSNVTLDIQPGVTLRKFDNASPVSMIRNANVTDVRPYVDSRMAIVGGGTIDCNPANNPTRPQYSDPAPVQGTLQYGIVGDIVFYGATDVTISGVNILGGNGSCAQVMGDDITIEKTYIYTPGDGFHVNGPTNRIKLSRVTGYTEDDFIALLPWDWARTGPTVGDIQDVVIEDCTYYGAGNLGPAGSATVKVVAGTRSSGYGQGVGNLRNVRVAGLNFTGGSGIQMQSEFDQIAGTHSGAGTIENVRFTGGHWGVDVDSEKLVSIRKLAVGGTPSDGQTSLTVRNVVFEGVQFDSTVKSTAPNAVSILYGYTGLSMQGVVFRDCSWKPRTTGGGAFLNVQSKTPVDGIDIDGLTIMSNLSAGGCVLTVNNYDGSNQTILRRAILRRIRTASGVTVNSPIVSLSGSIERLIGSEWDVQHTGGSGDDHGIYFAAPNALLLSAVLTSCVMRNAKTLLRVGGGATAALICKAAIVDCDLIGVTHPVFVTGGRTVEVTFRGGNVDTPANLARIDGSTATLSFDDATSSGVGATTITPVNTSTIRVPLSTKIALPLNTLALTEQDGDYVRSSGTPSAVASGTGAGMYMYRGGAGFVKLN